MQHQIFKHIFKNEILWNKVQRIAKSKRVVQKTVLTLLIIIFAFSTPQPTHALSVDCTLDNDAAPGPVQILCPAIRVVNFLVLVAGAVFVLMLIVAAYKYYASLGDPKTNMVARETLVKAVFGFIIVISTMLILTLIVNITGATGGANAINPLKPFEAAKNGICNLLVCSNNGKPIVAMPANVCNPNLCP